jgi:hypothetical protein
MQTEQSHILELLNCGRITLGEAETMLDSALGCDSRFSRIKSWLGAHIVPCLAIALITGVALRPALIALLQTGVQAIGGTENLQLFLYRLLEAFL